MGASRKKRLARLAAAFDATEEEAVARRTELRFNAVLCEIIRDAMTQRGIDPASSRVLLDAEAQLAEFRDSPELEAADDAFMDAHPKEWDEEKEPLDWLGELLDSVAVDYLDGSRPDFRFDPLIRVFAWALVQPRLLPAIPDDRYGLSVKTS